MLREQQLERDELVVCIVSGSGLKDIASARTVAGEPQIVEASLADQDWFDGFTES